MEQYKCPIAVENKQAHDEFMKQFGNLYTRWQNGTMDAKTARKTHEALALWIKNHILDIDTHMKACVPKSQRGALIGE